MSCEFITTVLKKIDQSTFELPDNAGNLIQITYSDGSVMPADLYAFLPPKLVKLGCPLPTSFSCLYATWTPLEGKCNVEPCCC